jgi:hypothetical protein
MSLNRKFLSMNVSTMRAVLVDSCSTGAEADLSAFPGTREPGLRPGELDGCSRGARRPSGRDVDSCANRGILDGLLHTCVEKLVRHLHCLCLGVLEDPGQVLD